MSPTRRPSPNSVLPFALVAALACAALPAHAVPPAASTASADDLAALVDTFIGTDDGDSPDPPPGDKGGATFPGAALPFGMVQWSPDTAPKGEFSYYYPDDRIKGFSVTHLSGPGCPALLDFPFLPTVEPVRRSPGPLLDGHAVGFRHQDEEAAPGFYRVTLANGVVVALTVTTRTGLAEVTFPKGAEAGLLLLAGKTVADGNDVRVTDGSVRVEGDRRVSLSLSSERFCSNASGYRIHLAVETERPFSSYATWLGDELAAGQPERAGPRAGVHLRFGGALTEPVRLRVGVSYVSVENAWKNLGGEGGTWDFAAVRAAARKAWDERLAAVRVEGGTPRERRMFYSALYRTLLHPNVFTDVTGEYTGFDRRVHVARDYVHYANFSGWDVYRTWVQLAALLQPQVTSDVVRSLVENAKACGGLPRWTLAGDETGVMVGDPASAFIANAFAFGARGFDAREALAIMVRAGSSPGTTCNAHAVRPGLAHYLEKGYLPHDAPEAGWGPTSTTLEFAQSDFATAKLAEALGDTASRDAFLARSRNWRNVLDPSTLLIRPRQKDGTWVSGFEPPNHEHYVEGNAVQYTFFVPHDVPGLIDALGGKQKVLSRLDELFRQLNAGQSQPHFYIGNEPQFSTPWIYALAGEPQKTRALVRRILTRAFTDGPGGLPGNDDLGATSSWYVWATLGLYPAIPGVGGFSLASPLFPRAELRLAGGARLELRAPGAAADRPLVERIALDGKPLDEPWLPFEAVARGGIVEFTLSGEPR